MNSDRIVKKNLLLLLIIITTIYNDDKNNKNLLKATMKLHWFDLNLFDCGFVGERTNKRVVLLKRYRTKFWNRYNNNKIVSFFFSFSFLQVKEREVNKTMNTNQMLCLFISSRKKMKKLKKAKTKSKLIQLTRAKQPNNNNKNNNNKSNKII